MDRPDLTPNLVHFIRGETPHEAYATLRRILDERRLLGGTGYIRGGYRCVCFSEAPLPFLGYALTRPAQGGRQLQPFGIVVPKVYLYDIGGRPVLYQSEAEFLLLPEAIRWRHVRYEPTTDPPIDFTWEREWRVRVDELLLDPAVVYVVLPSRSYGEHLMGEHSRTQDYQQLMYTQILDDVLAYQLREEFRWRLVFLDEHLRATTDPR